jgi:hypothetical protein
MVPVGFTCQFLPFLGSGVARLASDLAATDSG